MRYEEFAALYPRESPPSWFADSERHEITRDAVEWAHTLGTLLHDHLSGAADQPGAFEAAVTLARYAAWNQRHFVPTVRAIAAQPGGGRGVRAMHFHTLGNCLLTMWRPLFGAGPVPTVIDRRRSQLLLALHAAGMMVRRYENLDGGHVAADDEGSAVLALQNGMLSETDAALTLVEIVRHHPEIVVIPAPPQFESAAPGRNVDLLVLDVSARTVNGIQVKTSLTRPEKLREYHREGVVLVDGVTDLANERLARLRSNSSTKVLASWPGLISAHFLLRANPRTDLYAQWAPRMEELRAVLPDLVHGTTDYLPRAVAQLRDRILLPLAQTGPQPVGGGG